MTMKRILRSNRKGSERRRLHAARPAAYMVRSLSEASATPFKEAQDTLEKMKKRRKSSVPDSNMPSERRRFITQRSLARL